MKTLSIIFTLLLLCTSCDDTSTGEPNICSNNPLEEIGWLKVLVDTENNTDLPNSSGLEIIQYRYNGNLLFSVDTCVNYCVDSLIKIYDCEKNTVCEMGGIAGVNTCEDLLKEAKNEKILYTTRNTSSSFNCEKYTIISEPLYNDAKATTIIKAQIIENCLELTFSILSTQDHIKDVNLIDSGAILESSPTQRNLKLVVTENLTKPTSIDVTTSFDISNLVAWDYDDEIILNIEGLSKSLRYKRAPQCGDPNINCTPKN